LQKSALVVNMICRIRECNTYATIIIFTLLLINPRLLCHSIRLEYRPSLGRIFTYEKVEVIEVSDPDEDNDYSIERKETIYTERIVDVDELEDGIITVEMGYNSVELTPPNERLRSSLLARRHRVKINRHGMMQGAIVSLVVGDVNNVFPLHDVEVGDSWTTTINGLGKANTLYTLISVDENQVATIEMECTVNVFEGLGVGTVSVTLKFDSKTGVTITREETSTVQILSKLKLTTKSTRLIAQE
jgi:hypothetical protein